MLIRQDVGIRKLNSIKKNCVRLFLFLCVCLSYHPHSLYGNDIMRKSILKNTQALRDKKVRTVQLDTQTLMYYLYITDFAKSFIQIPTTDVPDGSTIDSTYLAGRAALYNANNNEKVGTCSASFLCMQNEDGIYTDISNFISVDSGLIVSWFTPTTLINLKLDSIIHSMVTECMVVASTKVGVNPFYGQTFNLIVSSDNERIYFEFTRTGTIF